jgi:hypothetical protein
MFLLGLAAAIVAAILFNVGIALQAIEARRSPKSLGLKVGLLGHLLRRPLWLLGGALGIIGFGPQLIGLAYAPFAVVQTALTAGLALLLFIAMRYLGERVDRIALTGVAVAALGVCATVTSMSAIQRSAATMVVPVSTAVQTFVPIVLEPLFLHEHYRSLWTQFLPVAAGVVIAVAGVALVGRNRAVSELATGR